MAYTYLVTQKEGGAQQLVEASSPSIAIADVAGDAYTAERVDGHVLALLSKSMTVRKVGKAADPAPAGDPPAADADKPDELGGKAGK